MGKIDPKNFLRRLHRRDSQVYDDGFLIAAHDHAGQRLAGTGVDFLMRDERRHEDKIPRTGLREKLQSLSPAHPRSAADDIDDAFQFAVMVRRGFGVGIDADRAGS